MRGSPKMCLQDERAKEGKKAPSFFSDVFFLREPLIQGISPIACSSSSSQKIYQPESFSQSELSYINLSLQYVHSVLAHLRHKRSMGISSGNAFFALLNLNRKINNEGQHVYCFSHIWDSRRYTAWEHLKCTCYPKTHFPVYMHCTRLTFGKSFVRKQYNVLVFVIVFAKSIEVPIELSEDCYCSVPIPNGYISAAAAALSAPSALSHIASDMLNILSVELILFYQPGK